MIDKIRIIKKNKQDERGSKIWYDKKKKYIRKNERNIK